MCVDAGRERAAQAVGDRVHPPLVRLTHAHGHRRPDGAGREHQNHRARSLGRQALQLGEEFLPREPRTDGQHRRAMIANDTQGAVEHVTVQGLRDRPYPRCGEQSDQPSRMPSGHDRRPGQW